MPKQSLLHLIKRWKRHELRKNWKKDIPPNTRGVYVLYTNGSPKEYRVVYIGVAGLGLTGGGGIRSRIKRHDHKIKKWTHYSLYEVHDNITRDEIREIEALLFSIFRDDKRIQLTNTQTAQRNSLYCVGRAAGRIHRQLERNPAPTIKNTISKTWEQVERSAANAFIEPTLTF
jgi:hypothetical protein